jgi:acyl-coenzyme A thioesterase PaaI-like protein
MVNTAGEGLSLTSRFTVTDAHQGSPGLAHGGMLTLAFDEASSALFWMIRKPAVTARLETEFLRPVPVGSTLEISARITGVAGRKAYTEAIGRLGGSDGEIAVKAHALFIIVPIEHFLENAPPEHQELIRNDIHIHGGDGERFEVNP